MNKVESLSILLGFSSPKMKEFTILGFFDKREVFS